MKKLLVILIILLPLNSFADKSLEGSLSVGQKAANFSLPNPDGKHVSLYDELLNGPVIITFYRGGWCPICNKQLQQLQTNLKEIRTLGAQLIAISPESPTQTEKTAIKNFLTFEVLSDKGNQVAKQYSIIWQIPESDRDGFSKWLKSSSGKTLAEYNDYKGYELPVPATFIIDTDKTVKYAFKDVDYKNRADINEILNTLESLQ